MNAPVPGTKPFDLKELKKCRGCGLGMAHDGNVIFYEVTVHQVVLDPRNIQRIHGLEQMMVNVPLARVFSPDNTIGHRMGDATRLLMCMDCAMAIEPLPIAALIEEKDDA